MKQTLHTNGKFLVAGQISLVLGILCSMLNPSFFNNASLLDFLSGAFMGFSIIMNLTFLVRYTRDHQKES